jgi:DNA repair photolyase
MGLINQSQVSVKKRRITSGTKEWADHNINCIIGCFNNCRYCYARIMAKRFGRSIADDWTSMKVRKDVLCKPFKKLGGRVMFPSTHDIFDFEPFRGVCFAVLRRLLESGNPVLVTSKPRFKVVKDLMFEFNQYKEQIQFRFTLTSLDDGLLQFWEPNAPRLKERLTSLRHAFNEGFRTSVSIEPFLDYTPKKLIEEIEPFTTESIWVGRMNYIPRKGLLMEERRHYDNIRANYTVHHMREVYDSLKNHKKVRFKDSIETQLGIDIPCNHMRDFPDEQRV